MTAVARARARRIDPNDRSVPSGVPFAQPIVERRPDAARDAEHFGPYTVHEALGEGGMATVHRAERDGWERRGQRAPIALKRLFAELSDDSQFVEGFLQEARLAKLLDHPNIARSYEHGKIDGQYFMAMEYVPGPTLRAVMIQSRTAAGAMPVRIVVEILMQLCDALAHAHELRDEKGRSLGLVHRDVTPANIILSTAGVVKLIDFGIAKAAYSRVQTQAGFIKGKVSYVAPEYTHGRLDHRADLFAVGVIAHEMLTGRRLFDGQSQGSVVGKVRDLPIHPPSHHDRQIPRDLDDIVMLALQRDPDKRWQNAEAIRHALANVARQLGAPVTGKELHAWVEWAFTREPWRDSFVGKIVARFDTSGSFVSEPASSLHGAHTMALMPDELEVIDDADPETKPIRRVAMAALLAECAQRAAREATPLPAKASPAKLAANAVAKPRTRSFDRGDTARDNLLDGWAPPTGTALVRPNAPARSALPFLIVMGVVATLLAALALTGYMPVTL